MGEILYKGDYLEVMKTLRAQSVDCVITDPLYDCDLNVQELQRVCRGNIIVFCAPENQFFKPDEFMFWVKTVSTKNYSKHVGRFVEMILILRGGVFNVLHWSQMTGVYDDRLIHPPIHPFEKPVSLMERLVRIYSNPGDTVLDPFNGSGSTGEACIRLNRNYIGIEKERKYCELSRKRWAGLSNKHSKNMEFLYEGDCLKIMQTLPSESVDCVITSPPYPGVDVMWGEMFKAENFDNAHDFLDQVWDECLRVLRPGCKLLINIANMKRRPYLTNVARVYWWARNKIEPKGEIIWNKGFGQSGHAWGSFRLPSDPSLTDQHENILVFRKFGKRQKPESFEKINDSDFKAWRNSMWKIAPAKASIIGHVAPFPLQIPYRLITLYTFQGETVLDPFNGSGTTGEACIRLGRNYIGIEIESKYCELSRNRWERVKQQLTE